MTARSLAALALTLGLSSCDGGAPPASLVSTITPATFVEVMIQLRSSPLLDSSGYLLEEESRGILEAHGLTADDLRRFVEVQGVDVVFMANLWEEIERGINEANAVSEP